MQQLEIRYFFPLTEQIPLGLDFKPCEEYEAAKRAELVKNSVTYNIGATDGVWTTAVSPYAATFTVKPNDANAGAIEVTPDFHVYVKKKPSWLARFSMRKVFGWNWKDK